MVLIARRAALTAIVSLIPVVAVRAQRGPTEVRVGDRPVLFGFALGCVQCVPGEGARGRGDGASRTAQPVWSYRQFPQVEDVIPGSPAETAGIRIGDVLKAIDGLSLLTEEGTRRMSSAAAGEVVRLTFERSSKTFDLPLTLGLATRGRGAGGKDIVAIGHLMARMPTPQGDIELDLWSDQAVHLTHDSTGAVLLRIGDAIIRLRVPGALRDTAGANRSGARGRGKPQLQIDDTVPRH